MKNQFYFHDHYKCICMLYYKKSSIHDTTVNYLHLENNRILILELRILALTIFLIFWVLYIPKMTEKINYINYK